MQKIRSKKQYPTCFRVTESIKMQIKNQSTWYTKSQVCKFCRVVTTWSNSSKSRKWLLDWTCESENTGPVRHVSSWNSVMYVGTDTRGNWMTTTDHSLLSNQGIVFPSQQKLKQAHMTPLKWSEVVSSSQKMWLLVVSSHSFIHSCLSCPVLSSAGRFVSLSCW